MSSVPSIESVMPLLSPSYPAGYWQLFTTVKNKIQNEEYSSELNEQIQELIGYGESNYTCWVVKKKLFYLGFTTIQHQDQYSEKILRDDNLKNFQIWDYRNFIVDNTKNYSKEYDMMDQILKDSQKNYHLWSNRTRIVQIVGNFQQQIKRTQKFLLWDLFNNSAWTYRAVCFSQLTKKDLNKQINFVLDKIRQHVHNQSAWNYLRGFFPCSKLRSLNLESPKKQTLLQYKNYPIIYEYSQKIAKNPEINQKMKVQALLTIMIIDSQQQQTVKYSKEICSYLATIEPIRSSYYIWLQNAL